MNSSTLHFQIMSNTQRSENTIALYPFRCLDNIESPHVTSNFQDPNKSLKLRRWVSLLHDRQFQRPVFTQHDVFII